jgi:Cyclin
VSYVKSETDKQQHQTGTNHQQHVFKKQAPSKHTHSYCPLPIETYTTEMDFMLLPPHHSYCPPDALIHLIVTLITRLCLHNDKIPVTSSNLSRFHSRAPPPISIKDYLARIFKYAAIEKPMLLLILVYIDRMCQQHPTFTISSLTVHRHVSLFFVSFHSPTCILPQIHNIRNHSWLQVSLRHLLHK